MAQPSETPDLPSICRRLADDPNRLGELLRALVFRPDGNTIHDGFFGLDHASDEGQRLMMWLSDALTHEEALDYFRNDLGHYPAMIGNGEVLCGWYNDGDLWLAFDIGSLLGDEGPVGLVSTDAKKATRWEFVTDEVVSLISTSVPSLDDPLPADMALGTAMRLKAKNHGPFNLALLLANSAARLRGFAHLSIRAEEVAEMALKAAPLAALNRASMLAQLADLEGLVSRALDEAPATSHDRAVLQVMAEHLTHHMPAER